MNHNYLIIGSGIAGLSVAHCLNDRGYEVSIFDNKGIGKGASGTPVALINPVTGRRAKLCWRPQRCYQATIKLLKKTEAHGTLTLANATGVLRPALFDKMAKKMRKSYLNQSWPKGWVEWLDEKTVQKKHPKITCTGGAIWVKKGMKLDMGGYVTELAGMLKSSGVNQYTHPVYSLKQDKKDWLLQTPDFDLKAKTVIFATGSGTAATHLWSDLPIHPLKGQTAIFESEQPLHFDHAISSLGYFSPIGRHTVGVGSTYEHSFEDDKPSEEAIEILRSKLLRTLPYLESSLKIKSQWAGVRATTPDKMPIVGSHHNLHNLYLLSGLGSKGMLYSAHLADMLAEHVTTNRPIANEVDIKRYQ